MNAASNFGSALKSEVVGAASGVADLAKAGYGNIMMKNGIVLALVTSYFFAAVVIYGYWADHTKGMTQAEAESATSLSGWLGAKRFMDLTLLPAAVLAGFILMSR